MVEDEQDTQFTIEAVNHHRNGITGYPFTVAIVHNADGRLLVIDFGGTPDKGEKKNPTADSCIAVLNLDEAAKGNIFIHPQVNEDDTEVEGTGYNAFRGDELADVFRPAIAAALNAQGDRAMVRFLANLDVASDDAAGKPEGT